MKKWNLIASFFLHLFLISNIFSQQVNQNTNKTGLNWGYSYDSTRVYLENLKQSSYVKIDSIGTSVEERAIWMVNVSEPTQHFETIYRVAIHARTHPSEVQSQWLTQKIIDILISDSEIAKILRNRVIFNIVPMYNPDGVELGYGRQNANGIDLERNWFVDENEPEVFALKKKYYELMNSYTPINIMLNMHGDGGANKGYFIYHHENGTSNVAWGAGNDYRHQAWIDKIVVNKRFYKGDQWIEDEDLEAFLMDASGEQRNRPP